MRVGCAERQGPAAGATILALLASVALLAVGHGCAESRAERELQRVRTAEGRTPPPATRAALARLVERWPKTRAAGQARKEIEWLDELAEASARGQALRIWDAVRRVGRAAEQYRAVRGRFPDRFEDLVPGFLPGPVLDPWGRAVVYRRTSDSYQAICYGADGIPGGVGESADVLVQDSRLALQGPSPRR